MRLSSVFIRGSLGMIALAGLASPALACKIKTPDLAESRTRFIAAISKNTGVPVAEIPVEALTEPQLRFEVPIQADCSGVYSGYQTAAFQFARKEGDAKCTYSGIVIRLGTTVEGGTSIKHQKYCKS